MKNVLIPTDFSKNALNAAKYATTLFENEKCTFFLLNTYTPAIAHSRFMAETLRGSAVAENESNLSKIGLQKTIENIHSITNNANHYFKTISSFDLLTHKITETITLENIDTIVSGTKGASGYKQVFMGTNTVRMIKTIKDCPIVTVPEEYKFEEPKHIAFPTDFKHNFSADVLNPLIELAKKFNSEIHIMHIDEENKRDRFQESNMHTLMEYMAPILHKVHFVPHYSSKSNVITRFLKELEVDILALVYNEHSYLNQLMREPVITNMAYHSKIPLLVLPN